MSFNATAVVAARDIYHLYGGVDLSNLSSLEKQWAAWYIWINNPLIATGLMTFLVHEVAYFGCSLPFIIIDATPYFRRWKIQPNKIPTRQEMWHSMKLILFSHTAVIFPATCLFHPIAEILGMATYQVPLPSWKTMVPQIVLFIVLEDMFHYFGHRALHWGPLYKHVHKIHHQRVASFGLSTHHVHPAEAFIMGNGVIAGPILYCFFTGNLHIFTFHIYLVLIVYQNIDAHGGYDFPLSLQHIFPFFAGSVRHDFHHLAFTDNYATTFWWCDCLFGTDTKYREYCKRVAAMKAATERKSKAEVEATERRFMEEMEEEGRRTGAISEGFQENKTTKIE